MVTIVVRFDCTLLTVLLYNRHLVAMDVSSQPLEVLVATHRCHCILCQVAMIDRSLSNLGSQKRASMFSHTLVFSTLIYWCNR